MRLSEVLSRPPTHEFQQVEGFLSTPLKSGKQRKISVGAVWLTYHCENCHTDISFLSDDQLYCIGIHEHLVSIDCALKCPRCKQTLPVWFLVESHQPIHSVSPNVRILKRTEKFSDKVSTSSGAYEEFSQLFDKADRAYYDERGAGAVIYLRKIYETVTIRTADAVGIEYQKYSGGNPKNFSNLLQMVDKQCHIIPAEFSSNGYQLFRELSSVVHGNSDEEECLKKYEPLRRLVIGILDNIKQKEELHQAVRALGWEEIGNAGR